MQASTRKAIPDKINLFKISQYNGILALVNEHLQMYLYRHVIKNIMN